MSVVAHGLGRGDQGQVVARGYAREPQGGPIYVPPLPYGGDLVQDRILRHDVPQWARWRERVESR